MNGTYDQPVNTSSVVAVSTQISLDSSHREEAPPLEEKAQLETFGRSTFDGVTDGRGLWTHTFDW